MQPIFDLLTADIDFYSLIEDQLTHLESTLGNKLSNRLIQIFEKYGMDPNLQYNSLLQMLSFVEVTHCQC